LIFRPSRFLKHYRYENYLPKIINESLDFLYFCKS
jgi:hypothetical protein